MNKTSMIFVLSIMLVLAIGGASAQELDFDNWRVVGNGQWAVEETEDGLQVVQSLPEGQGSDFIFEGIELAENFVFEAELGCISGNHTEHCPYFGIYFNRESEAYLPNFGYEFTFRPSNFEYQLQKRSQAGTEKLGAYMEFMPWAWNLEEWRTFRVEKTGSKIDIYVDDQLLISEEDSDLTGGTVGFFTYSTAAVFRNIEYKTLD